MPWAVVEDHCQHRTAIPPTHHKKKTMPMLNDRDRQLLNDLERQLQQENPAWVRQFKDPKPLAGHTATCFP